MTTLLKDVKFALRLFGKQPGFALTAIVVLAIGISANAAVFSVVNTLLLKPLPGVSGDGEMLGLFNKDTRKAGTYRSFSYPDYRDLVATTRSFTHVAAHDMALAGVTEGDLTRRTFVEFISANYFNMLGARLARGRVFTEDEERPGRPSLVTILSHGYWQRSGADPNIIGTSATVSGRLFTVVGVAPPGFMGTATGVAPEFWMPLSASALIKNDFMRDEAGGTPGGRDAHELLLVGRLAPAITRDDANKELAGLASRLAEAHPSENRDYTIVTQPVQRIGINSSPGNNGPFLSLSAVLMGMSAVVLLVACLNLANMLLARGTARRKEIAIRLSLGARRVTVVRQLLVEGLLLSLAGGAVGLMLGNWAMVLLVRSIAPLMPFPMDINVGLDWRVTAGALVFAVVSTLAFALGPALKLTRPDVIGELKEQAGEDRGRRGRLLGARNLLLAGQMALSLALLVAGALFVRGALKAAEATPGFSLDRGLLVEVDPSLAAYSADESSATHRRLIARLRTLPGIEAVSMASLVPFGSVSEGVRVEAAGSSAPAGSSASASGSSPTRPRVSAEHTTISSDYFRSLGLPVLRGREFTVDDAEGTVTRRVAIIDEPLAHQLFPGRGENPVGQFVQIRPTGPDGPPEAFEVVGVVPGLRSQLFDRAPSPHLYVPFTQRPRTWMHYHVRLAQGGPTEAVMMDRVRREIRAFDARVPVLSMKMLRTFTRDSVFLWVFRSGARIFTAFALAALVLALVGIYGVNAYMVVRRTREIGIRMALGATSRDIVGLILREATFVTAGGVAVGLALAVGIGTLLGSMLYEVTAFDPVALVAAPLVLAGAALVASYLPARRATRVPIVTALRRE